MSHLQDYLMEGSTSKPSLASHHGRRHLHHEADGLFIPTLEELHDFSAKFKMPTKWRKRVVPKHCDEMDVYHSRFRFRGETEKGGQEYMTLIRSSLKMTPFLKQEMSSPSSSSSSSSASPTLDLPRSGSFNSLGAMVTRKRSNSAMKLFKQSKASARQRLEYEEIVDKVSFIHLFCVRASLFILLFCVFHCQDGIRHIKFGTLPLILFHLVQFLSHSVPEQKKAGQKMFLAFINAYRRVETPSNVLSWIQSSYLESGEDSLMYIASDSSRKVISPQDQLRRRSTTTTRKVFRVSSCYICRRGRNFWFDQKLLIVVSY